MAAGHRAVAVSAAAGTPHRHGSPTKKNQLKNIIHVYRPIMVKIKITGLHKHYILHMDLGVA